jgi:hypothetical protein
MEKAILTPVGFKTWELVEDFTVETSKGTIIIPKGFKTDLASSPRLAWIFIPPFGRYTLAAIVHDYLCEIKMFSRKENDVIFYEKMLDYGTYKWKAKIMYSSVRFYAIVTNKK